MSSSTGPSLTRSPVFRSSTAAAAGIIAYLGVGALPFSNARLFAAVVAMVAAATLGAGAGRRLLGVAAVAGPLVVVYAVLLRAGWAEQVEVLGKLATDLAAGFAALLAVLAFLPRQMRAAPPGHGFVMRLLERLWRKTAPPIPHRVAALAERWHGPALVVAGILLPVGEGAGFVGAGLLLALLIAQHRSVSLEVLRAWPMRGICLGFGLWLVAGVAAMVLGGHGPLRPRELGILGPFPTILAVTLSAANLPRRWVNRACVAFVGVLALSSGMALLQYFLNLQRDDTLLTPFAFFSSFMQTRVPGQFDRMVAAGFYVHRLKLAHVLLLGIGALAARQLFLHLRPLRRLLELGVLGLFVFTMLLTYSRGALIGLMVATAVCILFAGTRWRVTAIVAVSLATAAALVVPSVRQRIASIAETQASADRALIWSQAVEIVDSHKLGAGLGNYPGIAFHRYSRLHAPQSVPRTYAHSVVLSTWAETGPVGLGAYVWMWLVFAWHCLQSLRGGPGQAAAASGEAQRLRAAAAAGVFAVTSFWLVGVTHDVFFHKPVTLAFVALVGIVIAMVPAAERPGAC